MGMRANEEAAAALQEYAELFALTGGDAFRVRSYQKAAKAIAGFPEDISIVDVRSVPGVGEAIAKKMEEFLQRGSFRQLDDLRGRVPDGVRRLTKVPSLGPKTAIMLYEDFGIDSTVALSEAITSGRLDGVKGLGPRRWPTCSRASSSSSSRAAGCTSASRWPWPSRSWGRSRPSASPTPGRCGA
jgi:DNA polymerase (family 10)